MKLWQKVSIISIVILLFVVIVCSTLLFLYAKNSILQLTIENAQREQVTLSTSFSEMVNYYLKGETNPVVYTSAVKYCFSRFANETSVLVHNTETLYSSVDINPEEILPLTSAQGQQVFMGKVKDWHVLIVGSNIPMFSHEYSVYVVKDITGIYNNIISMIWCFVLICGIGIAVGISLIILLVNRTLSPLLELKDTTRRISIGEYDERAEIMSKDEIGELAVDFNTMADAIQSHIASLEDTAQRQRLFIDSLTHEFKTPMTSMIIHTDTLLSTSLDEEKARCSLLHIHEQCRWLEQLTQELLKLITLGETIDMQPEAVEALFSDVADSVSESLSKRDTPLKTECNIDMLDMDYVLMKSLLINLIDNASKASRAGQSIVLRAYDNVIEVVDCGKGIAKDEIPRVTDAFYMIERSRSKEKGGSGLGLALAKEIANAHGAQLAIESQIGVGTTVCVIFHHNKIFTS